MQFGKETDMSIIVHDKVKNFLRLSFVCTKVSHRKIHFRLSCVARNNSHEDRLIFYHVSDLIIEPYFTTG